MNEIIPFVYGEQPVRVVEIDGEPWFVLADLCRVLDLSNPTMVAERVDSDALSTAEVIDSMGRTQTVRVVNEPGMYQVIFMSRKSEAVAFRRWITSEVLPTIRKHGVYATADALDRMLADPTTMIRTLEALRDERAARVEAEQRAAELDVTASEQRARLRLVEPKAAAFDRWLSSNVDYAVDHVAKALAASNAKLPTGRQMGRNNLFDYLGLSRDKGGPGWIFRNARNQWTPYQQHGPAGAKRLTVKLGRYQDDTTGEEHATITVRITPKGVADIAVLLGVLPEAVAERLEADDAVA